MTQAKPDTAPATLRIHNYVSIDLQTAFAEDVRRGLTAQSKFLQPKYFYDKLGSQLFDAICLLPEYYLTRAEAEIFAQYADEIVNQVKGDEGVREVTLLEMGSGSAHKTRRLVASLLKRQNHLHYIPVDISPAALETSAHALLEAYPSDSLRITGYASDYETALGVLRETKGERALALALFLGSNIGNFDQAEASDFLRALRATLRAGDYLLLGVDLKKEKALLEAAYDDALGVTAAFNLNLLARINRELNANFDLRSFKHIARYNEQAGRVELYLQSLREQTVRIERLDLEVEFEAGESIHTENSYKYDEAELIHLAASAGFKIERVWHDENRFFSSNLFLAIPPKENRQ